MEKQYPLFTVSVCHYNNGDYIFETLDSIFAQDYPNIELLISDDHSPEGFDTDRIIRYINAHRGENIKRVVINRNPRNLGTVRNLEVIRQKARGEYDTSIASDDVWAGPTVLSAFAKCFEELGPEGEWLIAQIEMCDENLQNSEGLFMQEKVLRLLRAGDCEGLLDLEAEESLLSAYFAYRRSFFEKIGDLSKDYYIIEDYTTEMRALRQNITPYLTNIVAVKHRDGGISCGNKRNGSALYVSFLHDRVTAFELEIEPYKDLFSQESYARACEVYRIHRRMYEEALQKAKPAQGSGAPAGESRAQKDALQRAKRKERPWWPAVMEQLRDFCPSHKIIGDLKGIVFLLFCAVLWGMGPAGAIQSAGTLLLRLLVALTAVVLLMRFAVNLYLRARQ